jgi:putative RNA 2'-phosphotransferase
MDKQLVRIGKFLSLVLRHKPDTIGLCLDENGWASIEELIAGARQAGLALSDRLIRQVVEQNDKQRFSLSEDGKKIRANQGHSVQVDLQFSPLEPPDYLYHGTATRFLDPILQQGLMRGKRHHVHLSPDEETAGKVGMRHGKPIILLIRARDMHRAGFQFYLSENGVWLTEHVPPEWIEPIVS